MRTVLAIETSSPVVARIAAVRGSDVLFEQEIRSDRSHNSLLFTPLEEALSVAEPEVIAVGTGPGSYVGIRISISAALGMAVVRDIPVVGLASLLFLTSETGNSLDEEGDGGLTIIGDARRGQVWMARIEADQLVEAPVPMDPAEARKRIALEGHDVVTPDPEMPIAGVAGRTVSPSATLLGKRVSLMKQPEFEELRKIPVVPIYLATPFVTTPAKSTPR